MLLIAHPVKYFFNESEESTKRYSFLSENKIIGSHNLSIICFSKSTGIFWVVTDEYRYQISRQQANKLGAFTSDCRKDK